ncbi:MAG TPA: CO dehydrogenase/CO-methylating acetyl-CoA synthase complex subunit beta [Firmicutes bacterium]|nr:CO dehydrogenase/CO-methylating acetyl-CoA synthase complex subunit beta [Bacillota bacterium]
MSFDEIYEGAVEEGKEPKKLFKQVYDGAIIATSYAEILLTQAIKKHGGDKEVRYPDTAYYLPVIRALSGEDVTTIGQLPAILNKKRAQIYEELTFENARLAGEATLYAAEIIEALQYIDTDQPYEEPWLGFISDPVVRKYGIKMVDWTIPGEAVIIGRAKDSKAAAKIVSKLMGQGMMIFLSDEIIEQLYEENVKLGLDYIAYPLGNFTQVVHAANYALRAGMMFGNITPGETDAQRDYQRRRIMAFVIHLGERDDVKTAAEFGCIYCGFPVVTDQVLGEGEELNDWYVSEPDYDKIVKLAMEIRGVKLTNIDIDIPINQGPAFEGETIRKGDMYYEMGNNKSEAFELVRMVDADHIEDGKIEVVGPETDEFNEGDKIPIGLVVDIYGRKMQEDFESVLERRVHYFINYGEGLWHVNQRDTVWMRISKEAIAKGFKFHDYGEILIAKYKSEFPAIVDRVQVTIYTDAAKVSEMHQEAKAIYKRRDERLKELKDEKVDTFYSCLLCQSFAPNHVCILTPERVGLCGAVSWLDAKAAYEIDPTGANQPVIKGEAIDPVKGMWQSCNDYFYKESHQTLEEVNLYTMMDRPMTSCGCFESIMAVIPEANGIAIATRNHSGMTPCGMTFSTLAGSCGGGVQTPGFMGIGRAYLTSGKFLPADGGRARIVWMPTELKDEIRDEFNRLCEEDGLGPNFIDKIADETIGETSEEILPWLEEQGHPALTMDFIMGE